MHIGVYICEQVIIYIYSLLGRFISIREAYIRYLDEETTIPC